MWEKRGGGLASSFRRGINCGRRRRRETDGIKIFLISHGYGSVPHRGRDGRTPPFSHKEEEAKK